jgi:single-stranded DNA-binding protein
LPAPGRGSFLEVVMILFGTLATAPARIPTADGRPLVSFRLASSRDRRVHAVRVRMRGRAARIAGSALWKGESVALEGRLRRRVFYATAAHVVTRARVRCRFVRVAA